MQPCAKPTVGTTPDYLVLVDVRSVPTFFEYRGNEVLTEGAD